jgi:GAF domain-containing protein
VVQSNQHSVLENLVQHWGEFPVGPVQVPLGQAIVLPIRASTQDSMVGVLVLGVNPYQALDDAQRQFLEMTTGHIANAIASARAYEEERKRAEALVVGTEVYVQFQQAMTEQRSAQFEYFYPTWNRWFDYRVYPSNDSS